MDVFTITQLLGKDPTNRNARRNAINMLRRKGITPIRRGWYDDAQIRSFAAEYHAYMQKHPKQRHIPTPTTEPQ
jgi:hypothetical protein